VYIKFVILASFLLQKRHKKSISRLKSFGNRVLNRTKSEMDFQSAEHIKILHMGQKKYEFPDNF